MWKRIHAPSAAASLAAFLSASEVVWVLSLCGTFFSCVRGGVGCVRVRLGVAHVRVAQFRCWCAARPRQEEHELRIAFERFLDCWLRFEVGFARHPTTHVTCDSPL